jgi:hypothetical protein
MVEVFKTNIEDKTAAMRIAAELNGYFPGGRINFDLDDCDKILRVESDNIIPEEVTNILTRKGFICEVLE